MVETPVGIDLWINLDSVQCYLTLVALRKALAASGQGDLFQLMVHPSFTAPVADGAVPSESVEGPARAMGIRLVEDLPPAESATDSAARLVTYAQQRDYESERTTGPDTLHLRLAEALLRARFELGLDLGDEEQLAGIAQDLGIEAREAREAMSSEALQAMVAEDYELALYLGVQEVPLLLFDEQYVADGMQSPEVYATMLETVLAQPGSAGQEVSDDE